jgi:hypothetical protein
MTRYSGGRLLTVAATALALMTVAGCGSAGPRSRAGPPASAPASASGSTATTSSAPGSTAGCDEGEWQTVPLAVTNAVAVPPVPTIMSVRAAQHPECSYDRVVFDITGTMPGYAIRYSSRVIADASGSPIALPGERYLIVTLRPAQAHSAVGAGTIAHGVQLLGFPVLQSWVLAGDFEGVVTIAIGLSGPVSVRTGELGGRLYIDVKE